MSEEERIRYLLDGILEEQCPECRSCRPRMKTDCTVRRFLLQRRDSDLVRQADKFVNEYGCKGFVSKNG